MAPGSEPPSMKPHRMGTPMPKLIHDKGLPLGELTGRRLTKLIDYDRVDWLEDRTNYREVDYRGWRYGLVWDSDIPGWFALKKEQL